MLFRAGASGRDGRDPRERVRRPADVREADDALGFALSLAGMGGANSRDENTRRRSSATDRRWRAMACRPGVRAGHRWAMTAWWRRAAPSRRAAPVRLRGGYTGRGSRGARPWRAWGSRRGVDAVWPRRGACPREIQRRGAIVSAGIANVARAIPIAKARGAKGAFAGGERPFHARSAARRALAADLRRSGEGPALPRGHKVDAEPNRSRSRVEPLLLSRARSRQWRLACRAWPRGRRGVESAGAVRAGLSKGSRRRSGADDRRAARGDGDRGQSARGEVALVTCGGGSARRSRSRSARAGPMSSSATSRGKTPRGRWSRPSRARGARGRRSASMSACPRRSRPA